jgi:hypothetical protein
VLSLRNPTHFLLNLEKSRDALPCVSTKITQVEANLGIRTVTIQRLFFVLSGPLTRQEIIIPS